MITYWFTKTLKCSYQKVFAYTYSDTYKVTQGAWLDC